MCNCSYKIFHPGIFQMMLSLEKLRNFFSLAETFFLVKKSHKISNFRRNTKKLKTARKSCCSLNHIVCSSFHSKCSIVFYFFTEFLLGFSRQFTLILFCMHKQFPYLKKNTLYMCFKEASLVKKKKKIIVLTKFMLFSLLQISYKEKIRKHMCLICNLLTSAHQVLNSLS